MSTIDDIICSMWKQLRMLLKSGLQFATASAKYVAKGAIAILEEVAEALDGTFGGSGGASSLFWLLLAAGGVAFLVSSDSDNDKKAKEDVKGQEGASYA